MPRGCAETCSLVPVFVVEVVPVGLFGVFQKDLRKRGLRLFQVKPKKCFVGTGVEGIFRRHDLAPENPRQATGIQIAALKRLFAEALPDGFQERGIGGKINLLAVLVALSADDLGRAILAVLATDGELEIGPRHTAREAPMLQHTAPPISKVQKTAGRTICPRAVPARRQRSVVLAGVNRFGRDRGLLDHDRLFLLGAGGDESQRADCHRDADTVRHPILLNPLGASERITAPCP